MVRRSRRERSVVWLGEPQGSDPALVGPKAAHLSLLAGTWRVPAGFCLTAHAYRRAEHAGGLTPELRRSVRRAYARLVDAEVLAANGTASVAVRSSAIDEDGPAASFAGQHDTLLNLTGLAAVLDGIERTWTSLRSEHALTYRARHGLDTEALALAVLVQRMVLADASGVAFSVEPVSGRRDRLVVSASWGLGESVVGGTVTPDVWSVDKATLRIEEVRVATKARMTVAVPGGTSEVVVPSFMAQRPSLADDHVAEVARAVRALEQHHGHPVDVEFAFSDGVLHVLQCRPITALGADPGPSSPAGGAAGAAVAATADADLPPPRWPLPDDEQHTWERDVNHFPEPITTLDGDMFGRAIEGGLAHARRHYGLTFRFSVRRLWTWYYDSYGPLEPSEAERAELETRSRLALEPVLRDLAGSWAQVWLPEIERTLTFWEAFDLAAASDDELLEHLDATLARFSALWELHFEIVVAASRVKRAFTELHDELFGASSGLAAQTFLQGVHALTARAGHELWRLRELAVPPSVAEVVAEAAPEAFERALARLPEGAPLLAAYRSFLRRFGRRSHYLALSAPTLEEDPTPILKVLRDALTRPHDDPEVRRTELTAERERALARARAQLASYPQPVREEFEARLARAQLAARLSEDHNFLIDYTATALVRRVFLEVGRRLVAAGAVAAAADVMHLTAAEVRETLDRRGSLDRRDLVAERADEMARFALLEPPMKVGAGAEGPEADDADLTLRRTLTGTAASSGIARGRVRVVRSFAHAHQLRPGEVLVAPTTSQPWTPLFATAAALVTETGGALSHTAVVAREYGLPAVVDVRAATRSLRDGMLVEVDGFRGVVRIVALR